VECLDIIWWYCRLVLFCYETLQRPATFTLVLCATCKLDWLMTSPRLEYCNALLSGGLVETFDKLQHAENNLARVVCQSRGRTDARPLLHSLHWLPVRQRSPINWLYWLTHKVRTTATPTYLSELVQTHAPPLALHWSDAPLLVIAAPSTWNSLPADIWLCESILTFKHHLITYLFIVQTHLVLLCCIKRLCIFGPKDTVIIIIIILLLRVYLLLNTAL